MSCCYINKYKIYIITQLHTLDLYETLNLHIFIVIWIISIKKNPISEYICIHIDMKTF